MSLSEAADWFVRTVVALGLPGVAIYYVRDRRKGIAEARRNEASADVDERTVKDKVRTSSIASLEAEVAAMQRSFEAGRAADADTIAHLRAEIREERESSALKDKRIRELESKVQILQARVSEVSDELARVSDELRSLHDHDQP